MGGLLFNLISKLVWGIKIDFVADITGNGHEKDILIAFCQDVGSGNILYFSRHRYNFWVSLYSNFKLLALTSY